MPSQSKIKDFCQLSHRESQAYAKVKFEEAEPNRVKMQRRMPARPEDACLNDGNKQKTRPVGITDRVACFM